MKGAIRYVALAFAWSASSAYAIPALQLACNASDPACAYDSSTETWVYDGGIGGSTFQLEAFANAETFEGGNGAYAWDAAGSSGQVGYLVLSGVPSLGASAGDYFDVTVTSGGDTLSLYTSGYGTPPLEDPNSLASHGIFDTYFEIYEFSFDGPLVGIADTQPGGTGTGLGYAELFDITVDSLLDGVTGLHADLFSVSGDGILDLGSLDKKTVNAFAPFSHDAEYTSVPEPSTLALVAFGLAGVGFAGGRKLAG